jgi:hypothetical protein
MRKSYVVSSQAIYFFCAVVVANLLAIQPAWSANTTSVHQPSSQDESTFLFAGKCHDGQPYRLVAYQKQISGQWRSYYDYTGPVGMGTVQTEATPRAMAVRVCRKSAEIVNARYWESV